MTAARPPIEPLDDPFAHDAPAAPPPPIPGPPEPTLRARPEPRRLAMALAVLSLLSVVAMAVWLTTRPEPLDESVVEESIAEAFETTTVPGPLGPAIYATAIPSTVIIEVDRDGGDAEDGIGSGVIVAADGSILTAYHVVADAAAITIRFSDGTQSGAQVATAEPENDIAVLSPDGLPEVLVPAVLGGGVTIGDPVWALGAPLGLGGSLSEGIVSGLDRRIPVGDDLILNDLIQFDAAVNPGSSGGPLLDRGGRVVGIVTALANPSGNDTFAGLGFAVPIAVAGGAAGGPQQ